jgi:tetratricopeptide (TPR) repeat protein
MRRLPPLLALLALLAACATPAPPKPGPLTDPAPAAIIAAIDAAAQEASGELLIQPLRDAHVEELRAQAQALQAQGQHAEAAAVLDRALQLDAADPAVLQDRAEAAIWLGDFDAAARYAQAAQQAGAQLGPLCRRSWATLQQLRLVAADAAGAEAAKARLDACTVGPPPRY